MVVGSCLLDSRPLVSDLTQAPTCAIVNQLWGLEHSTTQNYDALRYYTEYYSSKCHESLSDGGRHVTVRTHSDMVMLAGLIRRDFEKPAILVTPELPSPRVDGDIIIDTKPLETSIDLCASLLTMVDIGEHKFAVSGRSRVQWTYGSLRVFLGDYFAPSKELEPDGLRIGTIFNARNICLIAGIKIKWTNNLADHLRLTGDESAVFIFGHVSFLKFHQRLPHPLFPAGLIEETLKTLSLLFPQNDPRTRRWIAAQSNKNIDPNIVKCGSLRSQDRRSDKFAIWHDRLVILKQAFDESRPQTFSQWWRDRRDGVQWYTFWVAILILILTTVFGIAQVIEAAIQVHLSYLALEQG